MIWPTLGSFNFKVNQSTLFLDQVSQTQFISALKTAYPLKTEASTDALVASALQELEAPTDGSATFDYPVCLVALISINSISMINT